MSVAAGPTQLDVSKAAAASLRRPGIYLAAVATLTAVAFLLRFSQLHQSILGDEFGTCQDIDGHSGTRRPPPTRDRARYDHSRPC